MMKTLIRWSDASVVETVKRHVEQSPDNLTAAFLKVAEELNTSQAAVSQAWYGGSLRNKIKGFTVKSTGAKFVNVKNVKRTTTNTAPIHEAIVSSQKFEGMRVVTIRQYFAI